MNQRTGRILTLAATLISIVAMISACSLFTNNAVAVLWTNRPEMAAYAELFNAEMNGRLIEVVYQAEPWRALENEAELPDLVAGTRLDSVLSINHFAPVDRLISKGALNPAGFYQAALEMGRREEKTLLLPVSFSLPIVVFRSEFSASLSDDYYIGVEEMRKLSGEFNIFDGRPTRMGFSPRWQPEFVYAVALTLGVGFEETDERLPIWNDAKIQQTIAYAVEWINETNGGYEMEDSFESKYMYNPLYKLLDTSQILFNFMKISEFLLLPATIRENLDFRWFSNNERISVCDDVIFIGKTRQSRKTKTTDAFLSWLFMPETQVKLLETAQFDRMRSFGVAGGLSSVVSVNIDALPRFFPFLIGHIPDRDLLDFPNRLPEGWEDMRDSIIVPWLSAATSREPGPKPLGEHIRQWRLQQPGLY